jgi:hypothetical protein
MPDCPDETVELVIARNREKLNRGKGAVDQRAAKLAIGKDIVLITEPLDWVTRRIVAEVAPHTDPSIPHWGNADV